MKQVQIKGADSAVWQDMNNLWGVAACPPSSCFCLPYVIAFSQQHVLELQTAVGPFCIFIDRAATEFVTWGVPDRCHVGSGCESTAAHRPAHLCQQWGQGHPAGCHPVQQAGVTPASCVCLRH